MTPKLTEDGKNLLLRALAGETINFTKIKIGNGTAQTSTAVTDLANPLLTAQISKITIGEEYVTLTSSFTNGSVTSGFHITEAGIFAEDPDDAGAELLYAIGTEDESMADYVPSNENRILEMQFEALVFIGDTENVSAAINSSLVYATATEFKSHTDNTENPHSVTKEHVGLGNVPNVETNDQTPTFADAEVLATLSSGEKISTAFGKIKLAITKLINHIKDDKNPHLVTAKQVGAAATSHTHPAVDINGGALSPLRGGTGLSGPINGGLLRANGGDAPCTALRGIGALFSLTSGAPGFGTLPVSMGGTGVTTLEGLGELIADNLFAVGNYEGDGEHDRTIELGFHPRAILLFDANGNTYGLALRGCNVIAEGASTVWIPVWHSTNCILGVVDNGFKVNAQTSPNIQSNKLGERYYYIAIR